MESTNVTCRRSGVDLFLGLGRKNQEWGGGSDHGAKSLYVYYLTSSCCHGVK